MNKLSRFSAVVVALGALSSTPAWATLHKANAFGVTDKSQAHMENYRGRTGGLDVFKVRATMNADGSTDLYLTAAMDPNFLPFTNSDYSYAPQIRKVQLKIYEATGRLVKTENIAVGAANLIQHRTDLQRHQRVDAQATVDNVTTFTSTPPYVVTQPRTFVLNDSTTVQRRPDLSIIAVDAPTTVASGTAGTVSFTVKEMGGDLPADAICQADLSFPLTPEIIGYSVPVAISVDPGQTVVCTMSVTWSRVGDWTWRARVLPPGDSDSRFYGERALTNNELDVPIHITGTLPPGAHMQGFVSAASSASRTFQLSGLEATNAQLINYPPFFYYESNGINNQLTDYDYFSVSTVGMVGGHWLPYPISFNYAEYGSDGALVVSATGSSTAPLSTSSYASNYHDSVTDSYFDVTVDQSADALQDDATGTVFFMEGYRVTKTSNHQEVEDYQLVTAQRYAGHQIYYNIVQGNERYAPDAPFNFYDYSQSSYFVYPMESPSNLTDSYRVVLGVQDGQGQQHSSDMTFDFAFSDYESGTDPYHCFNYVFDTDYGYHEEDSGCSQSFGAQQTGYGGTGL